MDSGKAKHSVQAEIGFEPEKFIHMVWVLRILKSPIRAVPLTRVRLCLWPLPGVPGTVAKREATRSRPLGEASGRVGSAGAWPGKAAAH